MEQANTARCYFPSRGITYSPPVYFRGISGLRTAEDELTLRAIEAMGYISRVVFGEWQAESFALYVAEILRFTPAVLKAKCPATHEYIDKFATNSFPKESETCGA